MAKAKKPMPPMKAGKKPMPPMKGKMPPFGAEPMMKGGKVGKKGC